MPPTERPRPSVPATPSLPSSSQIRARVKQERRASSSVDVEAHKQAAFYVEKVKQRFRDDPDTFAAFRRIWARFTAGGVDRIDWGEAMEELQELMGKLAPDLCDEFVGFFSLKRPEQRSKIATATASPTPPRRQSSLHQGSPAVKEEPHGAQTSSHAGTNGENTAYHKFQYTDFVRKIQKRFPKKPAVEQKFRKLMGPDRTGHLISAAELLPHVQKLFKTAPELYQDYQARMTDFDRYRGVTRPTKSQSLPTPPSLDRSAPQASPRIKTESVTAEPSSNPYMTPMPARHAAAAASHRSRERPAHGVSGQAAPSSGPANSIKKEEHLDIKPFSAFDSGTGPLTYTAAPKSEDIDEDDIHLLMRDLHPAPMPQEQAREDQAVLGAYYPLDEELVENQAQTREDVRKFLSMPAKEYAPEDRMATPRSMNCQLMAHQKCGLTWLVRQEEDEDKQGGLLADDMGLGKTVQALALILARPSTDEARITTLIVTPLALLKQWEGEIQKKVKLPHRLNTHIYHGSSKGRLTLQKMLDCDVVLTTYSTLVSEYRLKWGLTKNNKTPRRPLVSSPKLRLLHRDAHFHRVILDEAHTIRNRHSRCSMAVTELKANYRLCLTGTPFMNNTAEIFPLIRFLDIGPYRHWDMFDSQIRRPLCRWSGEELDLEEIHEEAMMKLQAVLAAITLRRMKSSMLDGVPILRLPNITKRVEAPKFNEQQAAFYSALEVSQNHKLGKFMRSGADNRQMTMFIFVLLLRLRQACCHPHLIRDREIPFGCTIGKHQMIKLALNLNANVVHRMQAVENFRCPLCMDPTDSPLCIYPCGHFLCPACFTGMMEVARPVQNEGVFEDESQEIMVPTCPECAIRVHGDRVICYSYFKQAVETGRLPEREDGDDESSADDDDGDSDLDSFVVSDDEAEDDVKREVVEEDDAMMTDFDGNEKIVDDVVKREDSAPASGSEDYREPSVKSEDSKSIVSDDEPVRRPRTRASRRIKPELKSDNDDSDFEMDNTNIAKTKKGPRSRASTRPQTAASTSAAARKQYLQTLRNEFVSSAKIDKAMEILQEIGRRKKTLIFSQWTSFLDLLEIPIGDAGYRYTRYDGSIKSQERDEAIKAFQEDPKVKIMLVSLKAGNAGLNLTAAQHVLIMEPDWNPFTEDQAVDRTHRIGQKHEVTVHRLLIEGTVEDRILKLQERKRNLVQTALSEDAARGVASLTREELLGLFKSL